ncbi:MAG: TrkA family potassium uptake protein [Rhodospirillales bacterium]|nr:TrkA family potassium uptake protein [Rhodospirillales bacterium]
MRIAVLGLGDFGFNLAVWLNALGNDVIAVDKSAATVQRIMGQVGKAIVADAADHEALDEIGIREVDVALISVGRRLETTVLLTHYLREIGVPRIVVKVVDDEHRRILTLVGASAVVQPDRDIAAKVAASLTFPDVVDYVTLQHQARILAVKAQQSWLGQTCAAIERDAGNRFRVIALDPAGEDRPPQVPSPETIITAGDTLVLMGELVDLLGELDTARGR